MSRKYLIIIALTIGLFVSCREIDRLISNQEEEQISYPNEDCVQYQESATGDSCLVCHQDYKKNHHPINFTPPDSILIHVDEKKFPLFDGKIQCLTCHTTENIEGDQDGKILRGGPYDDIRKLCFSCHYQEKYKEINVHRMKNKDGSLRVIQDKLVCTFCHPQHINNLFSTDTIEFKADVPFLCLRCHPEMRDPQIRPHVSKIPSAKMLIQIERFEEENTVILPLVPRGKISCSTCHNPHQQGVLLSAEASAGADSHRRLRINRGKLCYGCHLR